MATSPPPTVLEGAGFTWIQPPAVLDSGCGLAALAKQVRAPLVVVDLARVGRIDSPGVREWLRWLPQIGEDRRVVLDGCSPTVVSALNLVPGFAADTEIRSIGAPYFCDRCDRQWTRIIPLADLDRRDPRAPALTCEVCDDPLLFDDIERAYLEFVNRVHTAEPDAELREALSHVARLMGDDPDDVPEPPPQRSLPGSVAAPLPSRTPAPMPVPEVPDEEEDITGGDAVFYLAVGVLCAILGLVVYQIVLG